MFNKLISNLPFNPSLIDQVSFYSKRLRKESGVRRVGFGFVALAMMLQVFAVMAPAQASLSCDPSLNDIIQCGFETKQEAIDNCNGSSKANTEFRTLLFTRGITCEKLATAEETSVNSRADGNSLISVGRKAFQKPGEFSETIPGTLGNVFWRPLSSWGNFNSRVLKTQTNDGQMVMVMFECGNLITRKDFKILQPQPDSDLKVGKSNNPQGEVKAGDIIEYTLAYTNKGGTAAFFSVNDILPPQVSYVSSSQGSWVLENNSPNLKWHNGVAPFYAFGNTDAFGTPGFITLKVKVNDRVPSGTTICNRAYLQDVPKGGTTPRNSSEVQICNNVIVTCPNGQILQDDGLTCEEVAIPDAVCVSLSGVKAENDDTKNKYVFTTKSSTVNGATIASYSYNFGDGTTLVNNSTALTDAAPHVYKAPGNYDIKVTVKSSVADKPALTCQTKVSVPPEDTTPTLAIKKQAANLTKKIADANNTTANAGDIIEYTLTTTNVSAVDAKEVVLQPEDLGDVLEYSLLDTNSLQGGVFDNETKILAWNSKIDIKAGQSITKVFKVTVKNPIPSTPSPDTNNRSSGDLVMHNWYGNPIDIKLPGTPIKTVEQVTTTLPNTGPGTSLLISFMTVTVVGYFFARSRLLATELDIVKNEYTATGGGY